jgi:hypothetical protein
MDKTEREQFEIMKKALVRLADKGEYEWEDMYGGEHGNGVSMGLVKAGKFAALALVHAGVIESHKVLHADVVLNFEKPFGKRR